MPNWCEGVLKVRGKEENLKRFITEGLTPVSFLGMVTGKLEINEHGCVKSELSCHIKNTHRGFVENLDVCIEDIEDDDGNYIVQLEAKFAWGIYAEELLKTCQEFEVDMKIYAFERGMEFERDIEIVNGAIVKNGEITYGNYSWESINPLMGG